MVALYYYFFFDIDYFGFSFLVKIGGQSILGATLSLVLLFLC